MRLRNLTPHAVTLLLPSGRRVVLPPEAVPVRIDFGAGAEAAVQVGGEAVRVRETGPAGAACGLPPEEPGVLLVVSALAALACPARRDLVYPATGPGDAPVRDAAGRITAVRALRRAAPPGPRP